MTLRVACSTHSEFKDNLSYIFRLYLNNSGKH